MRNFARTCICVLLVGLFGPVHARAQVKGYGLSETIEKSETPTEDVSATPIPERIQKLKLRERVSQLMLVTLQGSPRPDSQDQNLLKRYTPGGVIIPTILRPMNAADYVQQLRNHPIQLVTGVPFLIGTNLYDLPRELLGSNEFFVQLPSLLSIAAANDAECTTRLARLLADHLVAMGFNMHMGPSLELAPTLPGAVGTIQCFGSDPEFAAMAGGSILRTLRESGIVAMPLGFPGGGRNRLPKEPAVLLTPGALLKERDLLPYIRVIDEGQPIIHVGNTLVPTLDDDSLPASLSPVVMKQLLRNELKFKGIIIAGPMDSPDIARQFDPSDAARMALEAGADMIYWNEAGQRVMKTVDEIVTAIENGEMSQDIVNSALIRIIDLKQNVLKRQAEPPKAKAAKKLERSRRYPEETYEIERRAITLVQNRDNVLPLSKKSSLPMGVTGVAGVEVLRKAIEEYIKPVAQQAIATAKYTSDIQDFEIQRLTRHVQGAKTVICVLTNLRRTAGVVQLIQELKAKNVRVVIVFLGYPEMLPKLGDADAIVVAYCDPGACDESMKAVADVLVGEGPAGILPVVRDLRTQVGKSELFSVYDIVRVPSGVLPLTVDPPFVAGMAVPYDPSIAIKKAEWDFGDGDRKKGLRVERAYEATGRYPITLTITDTKKQTVSRTFYAVVE